MVRPIKNDAVGTQLAFRTSEDVIAKLDAYIEKLRTTTGLRISRANVIRAAVEEWLAQKDVETNSSG